MGSQPAFSGPQEHFLGTKKLRRLEFAFLALLTLSWNHFAQADVRPPACSDTPVWHPPVVPPPLPPEESAAEFHKAQQLEAQNKTDEAMKAYRQAAGDGSHDAQIAYCKRVNAGDPAKFDMCSKKDFANLNAVTYFHYDFGNGNGTRHSSAGFYSSACSDASGAHSGGSDTSGTRDFSSKSNDSQKFGHEYDAGTIRKFEIFGFHPGMTFAEVMAAASKGLKDPRGQLSVDLLAGFTSGFKPGPANDLSMQNVERHEDDGGEVGLIITHTDLGDRRVALRYKFCKQGHDSLLAYSVQYDIDPSEASMENVANKGLLSAIDHPDAGTVDTLLVRAKKKYSDPSLSTSGRDFFWGQFQLKPLPANDPSYGYNYYNALRTGQPSVENYIGNQSAPYLQLDTWFNSGPAFRLTLVDPDLEKTCIDRLAGAKAAKAKAATQSSF